jgi:hypothetical protein
MSEDVEEDVVVGGDEPSFVGVLNIGIGIGVGVAAGVEFADIVLYNSEF